MSYHYPPIEYKTNSTGHSPYVRRVHTDTSMPIQTLLGHWERNVDLGAGMNQKAALKLHSLRLKMMEANRGNTALQLTVLYPKQGYPVHVYDFFKPLINLIPDSAYKRMVLQLMHDHEDAPFYSNVTKLWYERDGTVYEDKPSSEETAQSNRNVEAVKLALDNRALSQVPVHAVSIGEVPNPVFHAVMMQDINETPSVASTSSAITAEKGFAEDAPLQQVVYEDAPVLPAPSKAVFTRIQEPVYDEEDYRELPPIQSKPKNKEEEKQVQVPEGAVHQNVADEDDTLHGDHYQLVDSDLYSLLGVKVPRHILEEDAYYHPKQKRSKRSNIHVSAAVHAAPALPAPPPPPPTIVAARAPVAASAAPAPHPIPSVHPPRLHHTRRARIPFRGVQQGTRRARQDQDLSRSLAAAVANPVSSLRLSSSVEVPPEEADVPETTMYPTMDDREEQEIEEAVKYLDIAESVARDDELSELATSLQKQQVPAETAKTIVEQKKAEKIAEESTSTSSTSAAAAAAVPTPMEVDSDDDDDDWEFNPPPPRDQEAFLKIFLPEIEAPIHDERDDLRHVSRTSYELQRPRLQHVLLPAMQSGTVAQTLSRGRTGTAEVQRVENELLQQPSVASVLPAPARVQSSARVQSPPKVQPPAPSVRRAAPSAAEEAPYGEELLLRDLPAVRADPFGIIPAATKSRNLRKSLLQVVHRLANAIRFDDPFFQQALEREAASSRDPLLTYISPDNDVVLASILSSIQNAPAPVITRIWRLLRDMVASPRYPLDNPKPIWAHIRALLPKITQHATGLMSGYGKI